MGCDLNTGLQLQQLQRAGGAHVNTLVAVSTAGDPGGIHELGLDDGGEATAYQTQQTLASILTAGTDTLVTQDALALVALDAAQTLLLEGLASGLGAYFKQMSPQTKIIGVEPAGAPCMKAAIEAGELVDLPEIDKFVDGAAVKKAGARTYKVCKEVLDDIVIVPEGAVCTTIIQMYNKSAIVVEPAGALSAAALRFYADKIKGKNIACIVSGSNNDITRMEEIREKSLLYEGLKHYFIVNFPQKSGEILSFIRDVIGPTDDLVYIQSILAIILSD